MKKFENVAVVTIVALIAFTIMGAKSASADWMMTSKGLTYQSGLVLGEESQQTPETTSDKQEDEHSQENSTETRTKNAQTKENQVEQRKNEMQKKVIERKHELEKKKQEQIMEIKMRRLDDKAEIKLEAREGKMRMESRNKEGKPEDLGEQDDFVIQSEDKDQEDIHIKKAEKEGEMRLERGKFAARTRFPLSINPETKELSVTTPQGIRVVAVLPDQAVQNLTGKGIVDTVTTDESGVAMTDLTEVAGEPAYQVSGERKQKFLGVFAVQIPTTAVVSASDGRVISTNQAFWARVLDVVSF